MANSTKSAEMKKTFKLPLLPVNSCGEELLRRNFRKTQMISSGADPRTKREVPVDFDSSYVVTSPSKSATGTSNNAPASLDHVVLRFYGYFIEPIPESPLETERVRKIVICYFLEDDTISISEPRMDNSGSAQGTLLKRHRIPDDASGYITFDKLAVGHSINIYNREYHVVDCDAFTREFYTANGLAMAAPQDYPTDQYMQNRAAAAKRAKDVPSVSSVINAQGMKVKLSQDEIRATKQFLQKDRQVLRLQAKWDDSNHLYGHPRYFALFYFIADDTLEITEQYGPNSGYDPFPSFCRRSKVPKPGGGFYTHADMQIGNEILVNGRKFFIYDYDKFTQDFMAQNHGITKYEPIDVKEKPKPRVPREPPPYNGYGDEEDSLGSWYSLDLKPPKRSHEKFDKFGYNVVKFLLRLENGVATDEIRKFVLTCYLADDTIAVFEPVQRNSGIIGGKFLQRQKVRSEETGEYFSAKDFYVGRHVKINRFPFVVVATDERSLNYMENNADTFARSDFNAISVKIQAMLVSASSGLAEALKQADREHNNELDYKDLCRLFASLNLDVSEQEILTVLRHFDRTGDSHMSYAEFAARMAAGSSSIGSDARPWDTIYSDAQGRKLAETSVRAHNDAAQQARENTTAASGARTFLEAYNNRRQLFHAEFKSAADVSQDGKLGAQEFATCIREKLHVAISDDQLRALTAKLFPPRASRIELSELIRLMNGNSNYEHNVPTLKDRR